MWDEDRHVVSELPAIERWLAVGVDYGTANVFAALMLGLGADGCLYFTREYRHDAKAVRRQLTDSEYSERMRTWMQPIKPDYVIVDPSASSFITQLTWDGVATVKGDNAVLDGIRVVSSLLARDRLKVHESCTGWIDEAPGYVWDDDKAEKGEDAPLKIDDHSLDAGRYAIKTTEWAWTPWVRDEVAA
jgi:phage terminase large subunit